MNQLLIAIAICLLITQISAGACTGTSGAALAGKCCDNYVSGAAANTMGTGVKTCPTATSTNSAQTGDTTPTACLEGYGLVSNTCTICAAGTYAADGATGACTNCPAGTYLTTTGNNDVADCVACDAGKGSPAGSDAAVDCVTCTSLTAGGKNCDSTAMTVPTTCLDGYVLNTAATPDACVQCTVANCNVCTVAGATDDCTTCKSGFRAVAKVGSTAGTCVACAVAGCGTCTAGTPEVCNSCKEGFAKTLTSSVITACTDCTTIEGCTSCTGDATVCGVAKPGWFLTTASPAVLTKCPAGQTSAAAATGADATAACTLTCDAGANCQDCRADQTQCLDCGANSYLDTTCQTHDATSLHPSCKTAWGVDSQGNANSCLTCNDANKVLVPAVAASADGKTPASLYGACKCKEGFKTTAAADATQDSTCTPCGENVKNCDDPAKIVCKDATFFVAGVNCYAKPTDLSSVAGYFFNTATSKFQVCDKTCATCSAANSATACKTCPATTGTSAPAQTDATFETWLQVPWQNETTCYVACPTGYVATETQDGCEASSSSFLSVIALILIALLF